MQSSRRAQVNELPTAEYIPIAVGEMNACAFAVRSSNVDTFSIFTAKIAGPHIQLPLEVGDRSSSAPL